MSIKPGHVDIEFRQGAYFDFQLRVNNMTEAGVYIGPFDFGGYAARLEVRAYRGAPGSPLVELHTNFPADPDTDSLILVDPDDLDPDDLHQPNVLGRLSDEETALLDWSKAVWDLLLNPPNEQDFYLLEGQAFLRRRATVKP